MINRVLGGHDGVVPVVPVGCAWLLAKCSNVTQMASWFSDRLSLGSVKKYNVINRKGVSCQDYFSNWEISKQKAEVVSLILMVHYQWKVVKNI